MSGEVGEVWEVWIPTLPYAIRTKNPARTVEKLLNRGYKREEMMLVLGGLSYTVVEYDPTQGEWYAYRAAIHPVIAAKNNICNAYTPKSFPSPIKLP